MPLYVRGTVSFGTVVATLQVRPRATRRSSSSHWPPKPHSTPTPSPSRPPSRPATLVDEVGLGVSRVDAAVAKLSPAMADGGTVVNSGVGPNPAHDYGGPAPTHAHESGPDRHSSAHPLSHLAHVLWWGAAISGLIFGSLYLLRGGPEVALSLGLGFDGLFTVTGIVGAVLSLYLYAVGRHYVGEGKSPGSRLLRLRLRHAHARGDGDQFRHRLGARGLSRLRVLRPLQRGANIATLAAAAGVLAPIGGAVVGLIPGCGPRSCSRASTPRAGCPFGTVSSQCDRPGRRRPVPATGRRRQGRHRRHDLQLPARRRRRRRAPLPVGPRVQDGGVRVRRAVTGYG